MKLAWENIIVVCMLHVLPAWSNALIRNSQIMALFYSENATNSHVKIFLRIPMLEVHLESKKSTLYFQRTSDSRKFENFCLVTGLFSLCFWSGKIKVNAC